MKKFYTLISLLLLTLSVRSQVNYSFFATTATYVPVTGGTTPPLINRPYNYGQTSYTYDEGIANGIPIGFTFNYNGVDYTTINICANGFATLGDAFSSDVNTVENFYINSLKFGPLQYVSGPNTADSLPEPGNIKPVLAPLWDDLTLQTDANLRYITTGVAGSRVFTFEWSQAYWQYDATSPVISFELRLYEGTNVVEFCYKDEGGTPSAGASASVGITASTQIGGGFMSLENTSASPTVSTSVETNTIYKKPANNQVYRFTPLPCELPSNLHYNSYTNTSVNFSWTAPPGVTNFEYAVTTSINAPSSGTVTNSTTAAVSSLSPGTKYNIYVRSWCSASSTSTWLSIPINISKNTSPPPMIAWQKSFGGSNTDLPGTFIATSDGGYIMAASSQSTDGDVTDNHGNGDIWIFKFSMTGTLQWQKCLGGSGGESAVSIQQTADGGYIVQGETTSNDGDVSGFHGYLDIWIVKLDAGGAIQWQKCLGGSDYDQAGPLTKTSDGGYILGAYTTSNDGDVTGNHGNGDCWIVKLDGNGNIQWQKCYGGSNVEFAYVVKETPDGGYIFSGATDSNDGEVSGNHDPLGYEPDAWIVKISNSGAIEWQKCLGGSQDDYLFPIILQSDGGYTLYGTAASNDGDVVGNHGRSDYWIVNISSDGTLQWQKCLGGSEWDDSFGFEQTADGGYIVAGDMSSQDGDVTDSHGSNDCWVVKLNSLGVIQWKKSLGGTGHDQATYIKQTPEGGYIIAGKSDSRDGDVSGNHGGSDCWLVKLSNSGDIQWEKSMGGSKNDGAIMILPTPDMGYIVAASSESSDGDATDNHGEADVWIVKLGADAALPVTLLNFSGEIQNKQNLLHWTTASEHNNTGFEIQRSSDGTHFNKIGFVNTIATNGNSNGNLKYDFTDLNFLAGINYYRLKQIDKDGKFSYSNIVVLKDDNIIPGSITVYPNPIKNVLNVAVVSPGIDKIIFSIIDISGRVLQKSVTHSSNGTVIIQLDVSTLKAGTYLLKVLSTGGKENMIRKFVKE